MNSGRIAILGAGSWGTAIAIHLAKTGQEVLLWAHRPSHVLAMENERVNTRYLPLVPFPASIIPTASLDEAVKEAEVVIIAVPSHAFHSVLKKLPKLSQGLAWLTKGLDPDTCLLPSELVAKQFGNDYPVAVLSGPSFAKEVAEGLPVALTLASNNTPFLQKLQTLFHQDNMRVYPSDDMIGVQIAATVKNVLAIACGISDGLGCGANARAAIITRGLAEMSRLGKALHAQEETFSGLAGLGDLVLTCTDQQSRNRRFGFHIGQGLTIEEATKQILQVIEGRFNAEQVIKIAKQHHIEMPISQEVFAILQEKRSPIDAIHALMSRKVPFHGTSS